MGRRSFLALLLGAGVLASTRVATAQTGENVLLVANSASPASLDVAEYYARKRQVPAEQIIRLQLPLAEEIERAVYESQLEGPLSIWLETHAAHDRILYLVLAKGVPLRIAGSSGAKGTVASVDSELTLLYRKLCGEQVTATGSIKNPYFQSDSAISDVKAFTHERHDIYLVARLDGYTVADVKALIDRGGAAQKGEWNDRKGVVLLNQRSEWTRSPGNTWLENAAATVKGMDGWSERVVLEPGSHTLRDRSNVIGYYSWGSNDPAILERRLHLQFLPGAIAATFVSTDGRTLQEPPEGWQIKAANFAGSNQSLMGDLIREGVTGVAGHVAEPYLNAAIRPDILFPAYLSGFNLIESFYLAMPFLSWQTVVIGDPLCAPFRSHALTAQEIDRGIDATTETPFFLSERRVQALTAAGTKPQAAKLLLKAEMRLARQDRPGARQALEEATAIDDNAISGHFLLGTLYEQDSQWEAAIDRYRRVIARTPNAPAALNNLAYLLAVRRNAPAEGLPVARRAYEAGKGSAAVSDTLGWIYHLLGNDAEAEPLVTAAGAASSNPETSLHAAVVLRAVGKTRAAVQALERALALDKRLDQREDVQQLQLELGLRAR